MYAFVYGTLRMGDSRFGVLEGCECISPEAYLDDFQMLHLGGFPGIIPGAGRVRGEVYEIDDAILRRLDGIEGYREDDAKNSLYIRTTINPFQPDGGSIGECITYVFNEERNRNWVKDKEVIESGDWFDACPPREHRSQRA